MNTWGCVLKTYPKCTCFCNLFRYSWSCDGCVFKDALKQTMQSCFDSLRQCSPYSKNKTIKNNLGINIWRGRRGMEEWSEIDSEKQTKGPFCCHSLEVPPCVSFPSLTRNDLLDGHEQRRSLLLNEFWHQQNRPIGHFSTNAHSLVQFERDSSLFQRCSSQRSQA